jgi:hypothetical protein
MTASMDGQDAIVFCILDRETGVCGFTWFIQPHRTSFYIKSTFKPLQMTKISIHGPDPNHIGKQHFRLDFTRPDEAQKAVNAGGGWTGEGLPLYFTGRPVNKRTVHIVRFSAEWNMFRPGMQRGPDPKPKQNATLNAFAAAPPEGFVTHIDLYLSRVRPFWRNEELKIRRNNAGMGPLINDAGMYLTAIISQWRETKEPDPFGDVSEGLPADQLIRGVAEKVDTTGLLWVCEKMMPKSNLTATAPPPRKSV